MSEDSRDQSAEQRKCAVAEFGYVDQKPVPITHFDSRAIDLAEIGEDARVKIWLDGATVGIALASAGKTVHRSGVRAKLLAYVVGKSECKTQTELAELCGMTKGAVSQQLYTVNVELARQRDVLLASLKLK